MFLTGPEIVRRVRLGQLKIEPFRLEHVGPNSYDVTLADTLRTYSIADAGRCWITTPERGTHRTHCLDAAADNPTEELLIGPSGILLLPGTLYLGSTVEYTESDHLLPMLDGRSSVGRLGVQVHCTAGIGDVGFRGCWTMEMLVCHPVRLYAGMRIGQLRFAEVTGNKQLYRGRYQGQEGPTASRLHLDTKGENR